MGESSGIDLVQKILQISFGSGLPRHALGDSGSLLCLSDETAERLNSLEVPVKSIKEALCPGGLLYPRHG